MKRTAIIFAAVALVLFAAGCKRNPNAIIELPQGPEYVGEYLAASDVHRIGHALDSVPSRTPVKWENRETGYQFSMMVFAADSAMGTTTRKFSILSIRPSGDAEVLDLVGTSSKKNEWRIVAEGPASAVGKAVRMQLAATPDPEASHSSGANFKGFMVEQD
ncbi:hypothetical protein [uncultured Pseudodesulfovibrio sp.]|uniref:hypothetical protein n=1 Tax=uncultured Pseudodesulfovibrio sp. TaxID=2035858 RepID=UPI0029C7945B|nr:hypothetical protein [uncultured Pseudodesulfovibrio sp.]